jgi:hypothetical protein
MSRQRRAAPAGQQSEPIVESRRYLLDRHRQSHGGSDVVSHLLDLGTCCWPRWPLPLPCAWRCVSAWAWR